MTLTKSQRHQVSIAPAQQKAALKATYNKQNAGPNAIKAGPNKNRADYSRMTNMPSPNRQREMPDLTKGNWSQTPATNNYMAPRGFGYYDAFTSDPYAATTHMSVGPATPIVGTTIVATEIETTDYKKLETGAEGGSFCVIVYPATAPQQAESFKCSSNLSTDSPEVTAFSSPQLFNDTPLDAIPTRCSVRIRNWTQDVATGGVVRVLRMTTGVALASSLSTQLSSNGDLARFMEGVRTHARTRSYSGRELQIAMQKNCTVVDQSRALWFEDWGGPFNGVPVENIPWAKALGWDTDTVLGTFTRQLYQPSFTPIVFLFEPFLASYASANNPQGNRYELTIRSQFLAHYPQGTMLANLAMDPRANPNEMIKHRDIEESKGSALERIASEVAGGMKRGGEWGWKHRDEIISILGPMIAGLA